MFGWDFEVNACSRFWRGRFVFELVIWPNRLLWKNELNPRVRCAFGNVFTNDASACLLNCCWYANMWSLFWQCLMESLFSEMLVPKLSPISLLRSLSTAPPPRLGIDLAPLLSYCAAHSSPPHPALRDLQVEVTKADHLATKVKLCSGFHHGTGELKDVGSTWSSGSQFFANPGITISDHLNHVREFFVRFPCFKVSGARTVLDIGVFTGASSLASALAVGEHGKVFALEKSKTYASIARWTFQKGFEWDMRFQEVLGSSRSGGESGVDDGGGTWIFVKADWGPLHTFVAVGAFA